jgi:hypothetical protein
VRFMFVSRMNEHLKRTTTALLQTVHLILFQGFNISLNDISKVFNEAYSSQSYLK